MLGKPLAIFGLRFEMKRFLTCVLVLLLFNGAVMAQLTVDESYTPQQLVQDVLVGQGVQISNVQFSGDAQARGYFNGSNSNLGLGEGVILSTGRVADAPGPNGTPASDFGTEYGRPGDSELASIAGFATNDAAVLEFDFVPISDTVQFNYVFASNEYMTYVGAGVNDVFAFLISGPGIIGERNVALIPGTSTAVTIDDVNADVNGQYYVDNENPPGATVEYNGWTTVLTALAVLQPCETYHIRLAIADGGDEAFDSAVFLEARSFTSPTITINSESSYSTTGDGLGLVEGCSDMTLSFERSEPYDNPLSVNLEITGTVTNGVDISNIPTFITFAAGESTATISFQVLDDGVMEGQEDLIISIENQTPCPTSPPPSITITIDDAEPFLVQITPDETLPNCPEERTITVTTAGGFPPYTYEWIGLTETTESITVFPFSTTTYTAEVTDACGFTETVSSTISLLSYQTMDVSVDDVTVCEGEEITLEATVLGGRQPLSMQWPDGSSDPTYTYTPTEDETITFQVTDGCNISESVDANVNLVTVEASFTYQLIAHSTVQFTSTTEDVFTFLWEFGDDSTGTRRNPVHEYVEAGDYPVSMYVRNQDGCETIVYDTVTVYDPLRVYIPNAFTPNGDSLNDWFGVQGQGFLWYDIAIYDKWGQILLEGRFEDSKAWDGMFKGKLVPTDQYVYKVWVEPPVGIEVKEVGVVNVLSGND
jgi:gliding motility-associated-like protein